MEIDRGRFCMIFRYNESDVGEADKWKMVRKRNKCGIEFDRIGSIIVVHYTWRNDIDNRYNVYCHYFPRQFSRRSSLDRHLYDKVRPYLANTVPEWVKY